MNKDIKEILYKTLSTGLFAVLSYICYVLWVTFPQVKADVVELKKADVEHEQKIDKQFKVTCRMAIKALKNDGEIIKICTE